MRTFNLLILSILLLSLLAGCGIINKPVVKESDYINPQVQDDAELLSLQVSNSITPDPVITLKIKQMLVDARAYNSTLHDIRVRHPWHPQQLLLVMNADAEPLATENPRRTGHEGLDELHRNYPVSKIEKMNDTTYLIHYERLMNIPLMAEEYRKLDGVATAEPDYTIGGGDNIAVEPVGDRWKVTFVKGWGDCPSGCIYKHYWEFNYTNDIEMMGFREYGDDLPQEGK